MALGGGPVALSYFLSRKTLSPPKIQHSAAFFRGSQSTNPCSHEGPYLTGKPKDTRGVPRKRNLNTKKRRAWAPHIVKVTGCIGCKVGHGRPLKVRGRHIRPAAKLNYAGDIVPHGIDSQRCANSMSQQGPGVLLKIQLGAQGLRRPLTQQRRNLRIQHTCRECALPASNADFNVRDYRGKNLRICDPPWSRYSSHLDVEPAASRGAPLPMENAGEMSGRLS